MRGKRYLVQVGINEIKVGLDMGLPWTCWWDSGYLQKHHGVTAS